jgi:hypothetical protein
MSLRSHLGVDTSISIISMVQGSVGRIGNPTYCRPHFSRRYIHYTTARWRRKEEKTGELRLVVVRAVLW